MNFADPISPGDAVRYAATEIKARAENYRREARELDAKAAALDEVSWKVEQTADRFDQYQPKDTGE